MSAIAWFFISMVLCSIGAFMAVFFVTRHKSLNAWVSVAFLFGAMINLLFIFIITTRPT